MPPSLSSCGLGAFGGRILLDQIQALQRNKDAIAAVIEQNHAFLVVDERDAAVSADAVVDVDHVIAGLQILQIRKECGKLLPAAMRRLGMLGFIEDVGLGVNQQCGIRQDATRRKSFRCRRAERTGSSTTFSGCSPNSSRNGMSYS